MSAAWVALLAGATVYAVMRSLRLLLGWPLVDSVDAPPPEAPAVFG
jgi:hypothetical protein